MYLTHTHPPRQGCLNNGGSIQQVTSWDTFTCTFTWQTPFALFYFRFQTFISIKIQSWHQEQSFPVLEKSMCSGTYLFATVKRWSPSTRRSFGTPYKPGKGHTGLQAYKHSRWPFLPPGAVPRLIQLLLPELAGHSPRDFWRMASCSSSFARSCSSRFSFGGRIPFLRRMSFHSVSLFGS